MLTPAELVWLIAAVAKGDEAAFERLYAATRAKLFGVVLRILRRQDLAEEVIQEAYVQGVKARYGPWADKLIAAYPASGAAVTHLDLLSK